MGNGHASGREKLFGTFVLFSNTDRGFMNMLIPKKADENKHLRLNVIWTAWKTAFKSGLKQCGSLLPTLDKTACGFWKREGKCITDRTPGYAGCSPSEAINFCESFLDVLISSGRSGTFSANTQFPCKFTGFQKWLFIDHNTIIINLNWLSICVSPYLSFTFGNIYKYRECGWCHIEHWHWLNHFRHLT